MSRRCLQCFIRLKRCWPVTLLVTKDGGRFGIRNTQEGIEVQEFWQLMIIRWFPIIIGESPNGARYKKD